MLKLKHKIIPIVLKDVSEVSSVDKNLKSIMSVVTYLEWPGHECSKDLDRFWKKLELSLPKKKQSSSESVQSSHPSLSSCDTLDTVLDNSSNDFVFSVSVPESTSVNSETSSVGKRSPTTSRLKCIVRDIFGKFSPMNDRGTTGESSCSSPCESLGSLSSPAIMSGEDILSTPLLKKKYPVPIRCSKTGGDSAEDLDRPHTPRAHIFADPILETGIRDLKDNACCGHMVPTPNIGNSDMRSSMDIYALKSKLDIEKNIFIFKRYLNTSESCGNGKNCDCKQPDIASMDSQKRHTGDSHSSVNTSITNCCDISRCNERTFGGVDNPSFVHDFNGCPDVTQSMKSPVYGNEGDNTRERKCVRFGDHVDFIPTGIVASSNQDVDVEISQSF